MDAASWSGRSSSPSADAGRRIRTRSSARSSSRGDRSSARVARAGAGGTRRWSRSQAAGERARGATAYVTLEPCAHHGATPPCTDALIEAGVARVVAGQPTRTRSTAAGSSACAPRASRSRSRTASSASARGSRSRSGGRGSSSGAVRHVQGRGHARRRGSACPARAGSPARSRAGSSTSSCARSRTPSRSAWGRCAGTTRARRARRPRAWAAAPDRVRPRPAPRGSELELRSGPLREELEALAADGVQSLLLEGGPDARGRVPRAGPRRQAPRLRRARLSGEGPGCSRGSPRPSSSRGSRRAPSATTSCSAPTSTSPDSTSYRSGMFTGIVRELGRRRVRGGRRGACCSSLEAPETAAGTQVGDSVSVNGCCLTVDGAREGHARLPRRPGDARRDARQRRGRRSTSSRRSRGEPLGGTTSRATSTPSAACSRSRPRARGCASSSRRRDAASAYCVEKGSIALDGVSLTVAELAEDAFAVALVPHTLEATTLSTLAPAQASTSRWTSSRSTSSGSLSARRGYDPAMSVDLPAAETSSPFATIEEAIEDIRSGGSSSSSTTPTARTRAT